MRNGEKNALACKFRFPGKWDHVTKKRPLYFIYTLHRANQAAYMKVDLNDSVSTLTPTREQRWKRSLTKEAANHFGANMYEDDKDLLSTLGPITEQRWQTLSSQSRDQSQKELWRSKGDCPLQRTDKDWKTSSNGSSRQAAIWVSESSKAFELSILFSMGLGEKYLA